MTENLNWKRRRKFNNECLMLNRLLATLGIVLLLFNFTNAQNIAKIRTSASNQHQNAYIYIGPSFINSNSIGPDAPCDAKISISLEDDSKYIFSAASAFNATFAPNDSIDYPNNEGGESGKMENKMTYSKSFDRIKNLKVGYTEGAYGKKWAIDPQQLKSNYPDNVFDIEYDNKPGMAFDQSNLFFEMLITIQKLTQKNEALAATIESQEQAMTLIKERIEHLENNSGSAITNKMVGDININPNPSKNNFLTVGYQLFQEVNKASFVIADIQGKTVYKVNLQEAEGKLQVGNNLPAGTYLCYLYNNSFKSIAKKLIIQ